MKISIVVPCHIPPTKEWIEALAREAKAGNAEVIIVHDSWKGPLGELPSEWRVFDYEKQKEFLGDLYEFFAATFHKSSASRVFGHILSYSEGADIVIGLDSDCVVRPDFVAQHLENLSEYGFGWNNTIEGLMPKLDNKRWYARGFPYHLRDWPVVANMGLWEQTLDLYGKDRQPDEPKVTNQQRYEYGVATAPIPFSGMNFALKREAIPGFLFLPNFDYKQAESIDQFRRHDDIWGGYIFQKLAQKKRQAVTYGNPIVDHVSEVIPAEDAAEEAAMYKHEEDFIECVDMAMKDVHGAETYAKDFENFFNTFKNPWVRGAGNPFDNVIPAMEWWVKVWEKYGKNNQTNKNL